jgi:hypothetical protein
VNFQVAVLKILVSYFDGFAVMADFKRDMAILATSGRDWTEQTKRLAARLPDLDIFSQALVEHLNGGWRITGKGRTVLNFMEARSSGPQTAPATPVEQLSAAEPAPRLFASTKAGRSQRLQRRRAARARTPPKAS